MPNNEQNNNLRILLIDDEQILLSVTADALRSLGFDVWTAQDCETGLAIWKSNHIDAVICDLELPDNCGMQVGEYIKKQSELFGVEKTAFILLTGWADALTDDVTMERAGVQALITKPVDLETLKETILTTCRRKERNSLLHCRSKKTATSPLIS